MKRFMTRFPRSFAAKAAPALIALALGALMQPGALAQQNNPGAQPVERAQAGGAQWGLGVGVWFDRKPYRAFDDKARVLPLLVYVNEYVSVLGPIVDVKLPSAGPIGFRLRARYAGDGYEADDSPYLAGMQDRDAGFWLGGAATWRNDIADLSGELLADVSGNSKGARFRLQADRRFAAGGIGITPRVAAQWLDSKYVNYYYGVRASEVRAGRPGYEGNAATNMELGVRVDFSLAPKQDVFVDLSATRLGSAIRNSPLVDRSSTTSLRLGYLYRF
ncbi:MAG: MipA/OmpV family protein [Pseudomonadota bacterium]